MTLFWTPNSSSFAYLLILMPVLYCRDYYSFTVIFEILECEPSLFNIVLSIQRLLKFHMDLRVSGFISVKMIIGVDFFLYCIESVDHFG